MASTRKTTARRIILISAGVVVVAAIVFGGVQVVGAFNQIAAPVKHSISLSTPTPTATKAPAAAPAVGSTITADQAAAISKTSADTGQYPYKLSDGSYVMTSNKEVTPIAVTQDIAAAAAPITAAYMHPGDPSTTTIATQALAQTKETELGKKIILVFLGTDLTPSGVQRSVWATLSGGGSTGITVGSKESVVAAANAWVTASADPAVVIVIGG